MATTTKKTAKKPAAKATQAKKEPESTGLYTAGMICGIIGIVFSFIPGVSWIGLVLGILALVFGIMGLARKAGGGKAVAATVLGGLSVLFGIVMMVIVANFINTAVDLIGGAAGEAISSLIEDYETDIVGKYADVKVVGYKETDKNNRGVEVKITNTSDKTRSFSVTIKALDDEGDSLGQDTLNATSLAPGESKTVLIFKASSLTKSILEDADYVVGESYTY